MKQKMVKLDYSWRLKKNQTYLGRYCYASYGLAYHAYEITQRSVGKDAKAIILTVLSDAEKVSEALKNGVYVFLVKTNWTLQDVVKKAKETLRVV